MAMFPNEIELSLHRYFMAANVMRIAFDNELPVFEKEVPFEETVAWVLKLHVSKAGHYMDYWYAGLWVVVEGWKKAGLSDPMVDALLDSPNTKLLRKYRHQVFHFHEDYVNMPLWEMVSIRETAVWIRKITEAFSQYFLRPLKERGSPSSGEIGKAAPQGTGDAPVKNPAAVALSKLGASQGGIARAEKLSPKRRGTKES